MALQPRRRNTTLPEVDAAVGRSTDIIVQEGNRFLADLERSTKELDELDFDFRSTMDDLRSQAQDQYAEGRNAINTLQRTSGTPPGIARLLSFLGQDEYNRDLQRLRLEETSLGLAEIDSNMQAAVGLREERAAAIERQLRLSSERFGLTREVIGNQRAEEAAQRQEEYLAIARRTDQRAEITDIVTRVIPGLSDEQLQEAINSGDTGPFAQFQGFLAREQRERNAAALSLETAEAALQAQNTELAELYRTRFMEQANINTLQNLLDRAGTNGSITTPSGMRFTSRELKTALEAAQAEEKRRLDQQIANAQTSLERALGFGDTVDRVEGLHGVHGAILPPSVQRAVDEYQRMIDENGNLREDVPIEDYFATIGELRDRVDAEVEAYVENYSTEESAQKAVRSFIERGGSFQTVQQSNSILVENVGTPDRLAGTSLSGSYRAFTANYSDLERNNFQQTFDISEAEEGQISLPTTRANDRNDMVARALRETNEAGVTPYQIAIDNVTYEYGVRIMQQLAEENADLWAKFVRGDNFVTASGNPSFEALWYELAQTDHLRRQQAAISGIEAPPSLIEMFQNALHNNVQITQFALDLYNTSDMETRAFMNSLGMVNQSGVTNHTINIIGSRVQQINNQGLLVNQVALSDETVRAGQAAMELEAQRLSESAEGFRGGLGTPNQAPVIMPGVNTTLPPPRMLRLNPTEPLPYIPPSQNRPR